MVQIDNRTLSHLAKRPYFYINKSSDVTVAIYIGNNGLLYRDTFKVDGTVRSRDTLTNEQWFRVHYDVVVIKRGRVPIKYMRPIEYPNLP